MPFDDLLCYCKTYARAFVPVFGMKALKQFEDVIGEFLFETDPIVSQGEPIIAAVGIGRAFEILFAYAFGIQPYNRRNAGFRELQGVADKVVQHLAKLSGQDIDLRQIARAELCLLLPDI